MVFKDNQSNSVIQIYPQTLPGCHGNKIWDSVSAKDICEILASIGASFGNGPSNAADEISPQPFLIAMATKLGQNGL